MFLFLERKYVYTAEINICSYLLVLLYIANGKQCSRSIINSFFNSRQDCWYFVRDEEVRHKLEIKTKYGVGKSNFAQYYQSPSSLTVATRSDGELCKKNRNAWDHCSVLH